MRAGLRSTLVEILADDESVGTDEYGDVSGTRSVVAKMYVAQMGAKSRQFVSAKAIYNDADALFVGRFNSTVTPRHYLRVVETGEVWDILGVDSSRRRDETNIIARVHR